MQERACSHGIAPSHLVPPTPSGRGRAGNDVSRFVDAPRLSKQGRAQPQDIVSPRLTPPAPSKRGRGNVQRRRVIPFHPARSIRTERCMRTRHCAVSLNPIRFIEVGMGSIHRLSSRQALPRLRYPCREGRVYMTFCPSRFNTPHRLCGQGNVHRLLHRHTSPHPLRPHGEEHGSPRRLAHSKPASSARALRKFYSTFLPGFACLIR